MAKVQTNPCGGIERRMRLIAKRLDDRRRIALSHPANKNDNRQLIAWKIRKLDKAITLAAKDLAEDLAEYMEWYAMTTLAGCGNHQLCEEATRLLRYLLTHPFDTEAARRSGLIAVELERRGRVDLWEQAKQEAQTVPTAA